jgi:type II secretion system protein I
VSPASPGRDERCGGASSGRSAVRAAKRGRLNQRGMTLVEVLAAVAILACGLVLVVEGMGRTQQAMRVSENLVSAAMIAEETLAGADLKLRESRKLSSGQEQGTIEFPGRKYGWTQSTRPYKHESIKDETKLNVVSADITWKEASREGKITAASLFLNREKKNE